MLRQVGMWDDEYLDYFENAKVPKIIIYHFSGPHLWLGHYRDLISEYVAKGEINRVKFFIL